MIALFALFISFASANETPSLAWLDAQIEIEQRRKAIEEKMHGQVYECVEKMGGPLCGRDSSGKWFGQKFAQDQASHDLKIQALQQAKKAVLEGLSDRPTVSCVEHPCFALLGLANRDLAQQISDITNKVIVKDWKTIETSARSDILAEIDENTELAMKEWACTRSLGKQNKKFRFQLKLMAECFSAIFMDETKKSGLTPKNTFNVSNANFPYAPYMRVEMEVIEKISARLEEYPDYTLNPAQVFRECAKEAKGEWTDAFNICYEVLRYNRSRPALTNKLLDIRGDRRQGGDNSGDWYHFFGMARLAQVYGHATNLIYIASPDIKLVPDDKLEREIDKLGGRFGAIASDVFTRNRMKKNPPTNQDELCNSRLILK